MRRGSRALLLACLLAGALAQLAPSTWHSPITAWAPPGSLLPSRAQFESVPAATALAELVGLAAGNAPTGALAGVLSAEGGRPEAVVVFVSSRPGAAAARAQELASAAGSWLQLPNAVHQGESSPAFKGLQGVGARVSLQVLGSCSGAPAIIPATREALRQHLQLAEGGAPAVAVVCADGEAEGEASLLAEAQAAVAALTGRYLMVHVAGRSGAAQAQQRRRLLQAGGSSNSNTTWVCDEQCHIQVKWLEGLIVLITVALAIGIGSCCMHAINTPTKFETPKETRAAGGHHE